MVLGVLKLTFLLHDNHSLKGKRSVVKSITAKARNKFNCSIAEVGSNDLLQRIEIGIAVVGNNRRHLDSCLSSVHNYIEALYLAEIVDSSVEIISL